MHKGQRVREEGGGGGFLSWLGVGASRSAYSPSFHTAPPPAPLPPALPPQFHVELVPQGTRMTCELRGGLRVRDVKEMVSPRLQTNTHDLVALSLNGVSLEDDSALLEACGVRGDAVLRAARLTCVGIKVVELNEMSLSTGLWRQAVERAAREIHVRIDWERS